MHEVIVDGSLKKDMVSSIIAGAISSFFIQVKIPAVDVILTLVPCGIMSQSRKKYLLEVTN